MSSNGGIPESQPHKARIEIIPLIDVIFFLLATFVLFTLSLNKIVNIPLELPRTVPVTDNTPDPDTITLQVSEEGTVYWNTEAIGLNEVKPRLVEHRRSAKNPRVLLAGDDQALFGTTVKVLDQIREAGIDQVSLETAHRATGR